MNISTSGNRICIIFSSGGKKNPLGFPMTLVSLFLAIALAKLIRMEEWYIALFSIMTIGTWCFLLLEAIEIVFSPDDIFISKLFLGFSYSKKKLKMDHLSRVVVTRKDMFFYRGFDRVKRDLLLEGSFGKKRLGSLSESQAIRVEQSIKNWLHSQNIVTVRTD